MDYYLVDYSEYYRASFPKELGWFTSRGVYRVGVKGRDNLAGWGVVRKDLRPVAGASGADNNLTRLGGAN
jgi:hypothetical protein